MRAKIFTVDEANDLIPILNSVFEKIKDKKTRVDLLKEAMDFIDTNKQQFHEENPERLLEKVSRLTSDLKKHVAEVQSYGCIVKDLDNMLIDFYSVKDNKLIFLCWKCGEDEIKYWHDVQDGFKARLPIELVREEIKR